jgi:hypothetical protein
MERLIDLNPTELMQLFVVAPRIKKVWGGTEHELKILSRRWH